MAWAWSALIDQHSGTGVRPGPPPGMAPQQYGPPLGMGFPLDPNQAQAIAFPADAAATADAGAGLSGGQASAHYGPIQANSGTGSTGAPLAAALGGQQPQPYQQQLAGPSFYAGGQRYPADPRRYQAMMMMAAKDQRDQALRQADLQRVNQEAAMAAQQRATRLLH